MKIKFNRYHRKRLRHRHYPTSLTLPPIETEIQRRKKKSNLVQALLPLVTYCIFAFHFISEPIHHSRLGQDGGFVIFTMLPFPHVIWASNNNNAPNKHQDECRCIRINPIKKYLCSFHNMTQEGPGLLYHPDRVWYGLYHYPRWIMPLECLLGEHLGYCTGYDSHGTLI